MNKIYIVYKGIYHESIDVIGVFSTKELALNFFNGITNETKYDSDFFEVMEHCLNSDEEPFSICEKPNPKHDL